MKTILTLLIAIILMLPVNSEACTLKEQLATMTAHYRGLMLSELATANIYATRANIDYASGDMDAMHQDFEWHNRNLRNAQEYQKMMEFYAELYAKLPPFGLLIPTYEN